MLFNIPVKNIRMDFEVKPYDIDAAGHVNNIVYIRWIEDLRVHFSEVNFNLPRVIENGFYLAVISTTIKYKYQVRLFDKITGYLYFVSNKHGIINFKVEIKNDKRVCAVAEQKCTFINIAESKMIKDLNEWII